MTTILQARPRQFVNTPSIDRVARRALRYLQSGYSVHLCGPAGTGKTTLALHLADLLSRPIMLLFGDDEFKTSDLIGNQSGFTRKKVFDNFIHSVVKMEDEVRQNWVDSRLTMACREGFTLVYDEFNRSRPEVNNVLLSALEEKLLVLPPNSSRSEYIRVNPHFRAIFTSNPAEYCGVHATQDALLDRLITINMPEPDELTQQEILIQKAEVSREDAAFIVQLVRAFRLKTVSKDSSGLRACLMIAKVAHEHNIAIDSTDIDFRDLCQDILLARSGRSLHESTQELWELFNTLNHQAPVLNPPVMDTEPELRQREIATSRQSQTMSDSILQPPSPTPEDLPGKSNGVPSIAHAEQQRSDSAIESDTQDTIEAIFGDDSTVALDESGAIANGGLTSVTFEPDDDIPEFDLPALEFSDESLANADAAASNKLGNQSANTLPATEESEEESPALFTSELSNFDTAVAQGESETKNTPAESAAEATLGSQGNASQQGEQTSAALYDTVPFEQDVYAYLQQSRNARPSQISEDLGITRVQTIHALRALSVRGLIAPQASPSSMTTPDDGVSPTYPPSEHANAADLLLQRRTTGGELP